MNSGEPNRAVLIRVSGPSQPNAIELVTSRRPSETSLEIRRWTSKAPDAGFTHSTSGPPKNVLVTRSAPAAKVYWTDSWQISFGRACDCRWVTGAADWPEDASCVAVAPP